MNRFHAALLALTVCPVAACADEQRVFAVQIDGKPAGEHRLDIKTAGNGSVTVAAQADIRLRVLVKTYRYTFRGSEVWKDGRLQHLETTTDDNGKRYSVEGAAAADGLHVTANGTTRTSPAGAWVTTYWKLPAAERRAAELTVIDSDTGREGAARLALVEKVKLSLAGQEFDCTHYRVSGGFRAELWYDEQERLVRQETVEDGHRVSLTLTRIAR